MTDLPITAIIPYLGTPESALTDKWLGIAMRSLPKGMPVMVAQNTGKHEMAAALNGALANVQTEYMLLIGADDRCGKQMVERLFASIGTADIAYPSMIGFGAAKFESIADLPSPWRVQDENIFGIFLARTETIREVGGWRDELLEDWDLVFRLFAAGKRMVPVPNAIYHYRIHKKSLMHRIQAESDRLGVSALDLAPNITWEERVPILATWYAQNTRATTYQRSEIPARYLPGVARRTIDLGNRHGSKAAIFEYIADHALFREVSRLGRAVIVDVDDNYLHPQLVQHIRKAAMADSEMLAELWTTAQPQHLKCVRMADAVIAATAELAMTYSVENKNVHLIPNMVDPDDWPEIHPWRLDDTIRIAWPAGRQHMPDAHLVEPALRWASAQPNVEVMCMGLDPGWDFPYHHEPYTQSMQVYRDILSLADIIVAPVVPNAFNRCKSDLKWLESAMVGAAFVGSKVSTYDTVWHGTNGLLARGRRDFERHIKDLVHSQDQRLELATAATHRVMSTRNAKDMQLPYLQVLASCGIGTFEDVAIQEDAA